MDTSFMSKHNNEQKRGREAAAVVQERDIPVEQKGTRSVKENKTKRKVVK